MNERGRPIRAASVILCDRKDADVAFSPFEDRDTVPEIFGRNNIVRSGHDIVERDSRILEEFLGLAFGCGKARSDQHIKEDRKSVV